MRPHRKFGRDRRAVDRPRLLGEIAVLAAILVSFAIGVSRVGLPRLSAGSDPQGEEMLARPESEHTAATRTSSPDTAREHRGDEPPAPGVDPAVLVQALRARRLTVPVAGVTRDRLVSSFDDARGDRRHEALDIMAPHGTPVLAVEDGSVAKLFESRSGGRSIYHFDPSQRVAYFYAHLHRYADGLEEGQPLQRGDIIGYVGSSGNAAPGAPHLHFAIFVLGPERRWWEGTPLDPALVFAEPAAAMD